MNEWMNEWMDGWMDEWMNEWMNEKFICLKLYNFYNRQNVKEC